MSNRVKKSSRNGATEAVGDCYEAAASLMLEVCEHGRRLDAAAHLRVVHAEVCGQANIEGIYHGHAFVLDVDKGIVIDTSNGRFCVLPQPVYYGLGKIDQINNLHVYTADEVIEKLLCLRTYGPWDLETSTGL